MPTLETFHENSRRVLETRNNLAKRVSIRLTLKVRPSSSVSGPPHYGLT